MPATEKLKTAIDSTPAAKLKTGVDCMSATEKLKTAIDRPPATKKRKTVADGTPAAKELKALTARRHTAAPIGLRLGVLLKFGKKMVEFRVKTKNNFAEVEKEVTDVKNEVTEVRIAARRPESAVLRRSRTTAGPIDLQMSH